MDTVTASFVLVRALTFGILPLFFPFPIFFLSIPDAILHSQLAPTCMFCDSLICAGGGCKIDEYLFYFLT
jgi:hypothetical protein